MQTWTEEEIKELILYAKQMQEDNDDLRAGIIAMQAKLDNEEAKVKKLTLVLKQYMNI
jgi:translation elongation factor EF-G